jgi:membrane fusion protein (multidrug efflux system)
MRMASDDADDEPASGNKDERADRRPENEGADGDSGSPGHGKDAESGKDDKPKKKLNPLLIVAGGTVLALALIGGLIFWLHARNFESTDDAFVDAKIVRLSPQIAGRVTEVLVDDNQQVEVGQPIVVIDSNDLQTRVAQAEAQRAQAQAQVDNARVQISVNQAGYEQAKADAAGAQAQADNAASDLARYRALQARNPAAVAPQQLDQARAQARQTAAQRDAAFRAAKAKADQIEAARTQVKSGDDQLKAAESQLGDANINLGYSRIVAPIVGHVAQKSVAVGDYVQPGTQILALVPIDVWVTANFKETQLALMRVGQGVDIHVDACPADKFVGHVDSIQRGAGQAFGILPPENATGNFVKVVQRVPVKIVFDHPPTDCPLGPGMSVEPRVRVR